MKNTELRIGNHTSNGVVVNIFEDHFFTRLGDINFNSKYHEANPIPLTEEWLLKFGFEEKEFNGDHAVWGSAFPSSCSFELVSDSNGWWYYDRFGNGIKIEYVHSLQNLYFCLVGEELTLNK